MAVDAQAEWANLPEIDKQPLREAFDTTPSGLPIRTPFASRHARAARAASVVRNLPARVVRSPAATEAADAAHDTMVVMSGQAWLLYRRTAAFVCEADRAFRPVRFIAFNVDGHLQREVPRVIAVRDRVPFTAAEQRRLMTSGTELDLRLADVISTARRLGLDGATQQVFLLTAPYQSGHVSLPAAVSWRTGLRRALPAWPPPSVNALAAPAEQLRLTR